MHTLLCNDGWSGYRLTRQIPTCYSCTYQLAVRAGSTSEVHMKILSIKRTDGGWMAASFEADGSPDQYTVSLFGTNVLPTGFTSLAREEDVLARLRELNPDREVLSCS